MTPPASKPATSGATDTSVQGGVQGGGEASLDASKQQEGPLPPENQGKNPDYQRWQLIPRLEIGAGAGANGFRDSHFFGKQFGKMGDFWNRHFGIGLLTNANGGKVQFRFGGMFNWDTLTGNNKTFGSTYHLLTLGGVLEANFRKGWESITGENWSPLGYLGVGGGLGFGTGTGTLNDGLLHKQNGLATYFNAYLNLVNFSIGKVEVGLNADYRGAMVDPIHPGNSRWPVNNILGFTIALQPSVKKMVRVKTEYVKTCEQDRSSVPSLAADVDKLKEETDLLEAQVDSLRFYLENLPNNPFDDANVNKAIQLGYVAEALYAKFGGDKAATEDLGKVQNAVKAAHKAESGKEVETIIKITGLEKAEVDNIWTGAEIQMLDQKGFWDLPEDPEIDEEALAKARGLDGTEECDDVENLHGMLDDWKYKLGRRNAALEQQYRRAVHLAGLVLGEEKIGTVFGATFLRVDTPNFVTGNPTQGQLDALASAASGKSAGNPGTIEEFVKISKATKGHRGKKSVFQLPEEEAKKLKNFAEWMNGKAMLQGEEQHRKFLEDRGIKTSDLSKEEHVQQAYNDWVKTLKIMVVGHTDSRGKDSYNEELSKRRSQYIKEALIYFGVEASRVEAFGAGEGYPIVPECKGRSERCIAARNKNRRVEFVPINVDPTSTGLDASKLGSGDGDEHVDATTSGKDQAKGDTPKEGKRPRKPEKPKVPLDDIPGPDRGDK